MFTGIDDNQRGAAPRGRLGIALALLLLLVGAVAGLTPAAPAPVDLDGRQVVSAAAHDGTARLPEPQAQSRLSPAGPAVSPHRWKAAPAGSPGPDPDGLAVDSPWRPRTEPHPLPAPAATAPVVASPAVPSPYRPQAPPAAA